MGYLSSKTIIGDMSVRYLALSVITMIITGSVACKKLSYQPEPAPVSFQGVTKIAPTGTGSYILSWEKDSKSTVAIDHYDIYMQEIVSAETAPQVSLWDRVKNKANQLMLANEGSESGAMIIEMNDADSPIGKGKVLGVVNGEKTSYEISKLDPGNYGFHIRAIAADGRRDTNRKVLLFTVAEESYPFLGLQSAEISGSNILLKWAPLITKLKGNEVYYTVFEGEAFSNPIKITKETHLEVPLIGKLPGSVWTYGVRATDPLGKMDSNPVIKIVTIPEDTSDYLGCINGEAIGAASIGIDFEWPPFGADKVTIYRNGANVFTTSDKTVTRFTDIGLLEGETYEYKCEATILGTQKMGINKVDVKTLSTNPPTFAGIKNVTVLSPHSIKVSWGVATGVPVDKFKIYSSLGNTLDWSSTPIAEAGQSALESVIENLGDELPYIFGVRACSHKGVCDQNVISIKANLLDGGAPLTVGVTDAKIENGKLLVIAPWKHQDGAVMKRKLYIKMDAKSELLSDYTLAKTVLVSNVLNPETTIEYANMIEKHDYHLIVKDEDQNGQMSTNMTIYSMNSGDLSPPDFTGIGSLSLGETGYKEDTLKAGFVAIDSESVNPSGASHYQVYLKVGVGDACTQGTLHREFSAVPYEKGKTYEYIIDGLQARTIYSICLKARDTGGNISKTSSYLVKSTLDTTPPVFDGIQELSYDPNTGLMTVKWNPSLSADVLEYKVNLWENDPSPPEDDVLPLKKAHGQFPNGFAFNNMVFSFGSNDTLYAVVEACDDAHLIPSGVQNCTTAPLSSALKITLADIDPPPGFAGIAAEGQQLTPEEGTVEINWIVPMDWSDYRGFKVYHYNEETAALEFLKNCACTQAGCPEMPASCTLTGLTPFRTYNFHVRAYDESGNITLLDPAGRSTKKRVSDTTIPNFASNISLNFEEATSKLTWAKATDNQFSLEPGAVINYKIFRKKDTTFGSATNPDADGIDLVSTQELFHNDKENLESGVTYYYGICAYDGTGNKACDGNIKTVTTPDLIPPTLTNLTTTKTAEDKTWNISWTMSDNMSAMLLVKVRVTYTDEANAPVTEADSTIASGYDLTSLNSLKGPKDADKWINYMVTVEDDAGNKTSATISLFSQNKVTLSEVKSNEGPSSGGKYILLKGTGFHASSHITIGSDDCLNTQLISKELLFCQTPAKPEGQYDVKVENSEGSSANLVRVYSYCTENSTCSNICNNPVSWGTYFAEGNGTQGSPYKICSAVQLNNIRTQGHGKFLELADNIDLSSYTSNTFPPLYTYLANYYFYAYMDGKNHVIANWTYSAPNSDNVGLFGYLYPGYDISNIGLVNVDVTGRTYVGGLFGNAHSSATTSMQNVFVTGKVKGYRWVGGVIGWGPLTILGASFNGEVSGDYGVGGIAGYKSYTSGGLTSVGTIKATGSHKAATPHPIYGTTGDTHGCRAGGLIGHYDGNGQGLEDVHSSANVECGIGSDLNLKYTDHTGGLFGLAYSINCIRCYSTGKITAIGNSVGGLTGQGSAVYEESYFAGEVIGNANVGGLVGNKHSASGPINKSYNIGKVTGRTTSIGGLVGYGGQDTFIVDSYSEGPVNGIGTTVSHNPSYVGGLVGNAYISRINTSYSKSPITVTTMTVGNSNYVGGLVGMAERTQIKESYATGDVNTQSHHVGGLVGAVTWWNNAGTEHDLNYASGNVFGLNYVGGYCGTCTSGTTFGITNSYATGSVTGQTYTGGFAGWITNGGFATDVSLCYARGNVTGLQHVGGFAGRIESSVTVEKSYALGDVKGADYVGGFVAYLYYQNIFISQSFAKGNVEGDNFVGGFLAYATYPDCCGHQLNGVTDSYAMGNVKALDTMGGFAGHSTDIIQRVFATGQIIRKVSGAGARGGIVANFKKRTGLNDTPDSFWDTETTGLGTGTPGKGKSTDDMKKQATYTNWDFSNVWSIVDGQGYPKLLWQP